jgi:adenosylhomocysteine nucleosidase
MKKIWIIWAMQEEIDYLIESMKSMEQKDQFFIWTIWEYEVVLVKSWIWKVNAALMTQTLIKDFQVELVINTWIAWAMHSGLNMLDFVVSKDAVYHDFDVTAFGYKPTQIPRMETSCFLGNTEWNQKIIKCFEKIQDSDLFKGHKIIEWRIATWDQFISDMETKQHIIDICDPACVEMEWTAIAHACRYNKIPFVIIRCMSDCADQKWHEKSEFNEHLAAKMSATLVKEVLEWDNN